MTVATRTSARRAIAIALACLMAGAAGGWAARQVFAPPEPPAEVLPYTLVDVTEGSVGSALEVTASATWAAASLGTNESAGIITQIEVDPGAMVSGGEILYRVDERPVVGLEGEIPAYRDLAIGARGADVRQLQAFLSAQDLLSGEPDGVFGPATAAAVRAWQRELGLPVTGAVSLGDVIFLPELPARVRFADDLGRGDRLNGGESVIDVYSAAPAFQIALSENQVSVITPGMSVEVAGPNGPWPAVIDRVDEGDDGVMLATIVAPEGGAVCGEECESIPVEGPSFFPATVILIPDTAGPMVPVAALVTAADGGYQVVLENGTRTDVEVVAQGGGYAIIDGAAIGTTVRVPGE